LEHFEASICKFITREIKPFVIVLDALHNMFEIDWCYSRFLSAQFLKVWTKLHCFAQHYGRIFTTHFVIVYVKLLEARVFADDSA